MVLPFGVVNAKLKTQIAAPVFVAFRILSVANALWARKILHPHPSYERCKWCLFCCFYACIFPLYHVKFVAYFKTWGTSMTFFFPLCERKAINNYITWGFPIFLQLHIILQNVRNPFTKIFYIYLKLKAQVFIIYTAEIHF
jgi:nitrate reductase NapE component